MSLEPMTEAGRALLRSLHAQAPVHVPLAQDARAICDIEEEVLAAARERVKALPTDTINGRPIDPLMVNRAAVLAVLTEPSGS